VPFDSNDFPNLHPGNYRGDGPAIDDDDYNCIWDPYPQEPKEDYYWPIGVDQDCHIDTLVKAFESERYAALTEEGKPVDGTLQEGIEKIPLYADDDEYTHASRQLESGKWTSKMGLLGERIEHDTPEDVTGPSYGKVVKFMQRKRSEKANGK
jgi:hypothetical protein